MRERHPLASKRWQDLSQRQKTGIIVQGTLQLALMAWTLWDVRRRDPATLNGGKRLWTALAFVQPLGPIAYFFFGRKR